MKVDKEKIFRCRKCHIFENDIRAYASAFASFLLKEISDTKHIDGIILYGSVASGTAAKESDVDIFIDTKKDMRNEIKEILKKFYGSREAALFKLRGVDNEISLKTGELKNWKELHRSISSNGIFLWGEYETDEIEGKKRSIIFYWSEIGKGRSAFLNKLYGFSSKGKRYQGMLKSWEGVKLGKSCVIMPFKYKKEMFGLIKKYEVNAKTLEVFALK
ncbi:MAG: nucleotidyltransferase domain-containing protein [Nanoarchaeota archaeon]|nr:nucleotidyltransferase domain-containing protein [Nanoarchaeota archaeon]